MKEYGAGKLEFFILGIGKIIFKQEKGKVKLVNLKNCLCLMCMV